MTNLQYHPYDWTIPIGYTLATDISIPKAISVEYLTSHGPTGSPVTFSLSQALVNRWGRERYVRANIESELPTLASTASLGPNHRFAYNFQTTYDSLGLTGANREAYALGQGDAYQAPWNRSYWTLLALVYKIVKFRLDRGDSFTGNEEAFTNTHQTQLSNKCTDILTELTKYDKGLQRANWNYNNPFYIITEPILDGITGTGLGKACGGAGGYLASPNTLDGIITSLDILGTDPIVTPDIKQKLETLIRREILLIIKNWKNYLSWYVVGNQTNTNQAIEPICGLIQACLYLEDQNFLPAYTVGTTILRDSFSTGFGASGGFAEGYGYAYATCPAVHKALRGIRDTGDTSLDASSANWVENNWKWMIDHIMPGNYVANYSDNANSKLEAWLINSPHPAVSAAVVAASVVAGAVADYQPLKNLNVIYPGAIPIEAQQLEWYDLSKLPGSTTTSELTALPTFVHYKDSALVIWRSKRDVIKHVNDGTAGVTSFGMWIKGATPLDGHVHRDAGQISVNMGKKIILMDSGSNYSHPNQLELRGVSGHNILQIDTIPHGVWPVYSGWTACPITVNQLGTTSGNVNINLLGAYMGPGVTRADLSGTQLLLDLQAGKISDISRGITWQFNIGTNLHITIKDGVTFTQEVEGEHYRWHTGSTAAIGGSGFTFTENSTIWTVKWAGVTMTITPSRGITLTAITGPNYTQVSRTLSYHNILKITPVVSGSTFSVTTVIDSGI